MSMDLYLVTMTDGLATEVRLVGARRESSASSYGELQAAKLSRMVQRTWRLHAVSRVESVPVADDPDGKIMVRLIE